MAQITLRDYLQEAEDAIRDDRIDDAFTHCRNTLAQFPESLEAQRLLGEAYLAHGQLEEAQQSFDWILTNDPENVVAYCNRALICERSSDYDTALDCYQQAYELSHGNSQIRREFNRLSAETGPQGFMFSRAGLARLYMRGDLLTQAIQEWETVLAISPERLDARTGLLETCWREAYYDRVEQLATQILQDVPGCLKALFLLAYVTSAKNIQQAQELLKRAEALDPDLLMAQELFSDMMARQPAEPFLQLLKKAPATIETAQVQTAATLVSMQEEASAQPTYMPTAMSSEAFTGWNSVGMGATESWGNDITLIKGAQEEQQMAEPSSVPVWSADASPALDVWSVLEGPQGSGSLQELQNVSAQLQSNMNDRDSLNYGQSVEPLESTPQQWANPPVSSGDSGIWANPPGSSGDSGIWANPPKEGAMPSLPAWLNMLTQSEIQQLNDGETSEPSPVEELPLEEPVALPSPVQATHKKESVVAAKPVVDEEEDGFSFGPEWLKSLGAASIEDETSPVSSSSSAIASEQEVEQPSPVSQVYEPYEAPADEPQLQPSSENFASPVGTVEYDVLTTLEGLEAGLRSQGFIPLEPKTLQTIAKTQETASSAVPKTPELTLPEDEEIYQYESSPSALAERESFGQEPVNSPPAVTSSVASTQKASNPPFEEPSWLASLSAMSTPSPAAERQQEDQIYATLPAAQPSWTGNYTPSEISSFSSVQEEAQIPSEGDGAQPTQPLAGMSSWFQQREPAREEEGANRPEPDAAHSTWSPMNRSQEIEAGQSPARSATGALAYQSASANNDILLNSELETTMKRPAVRLQPMEEQFYSFDQNDRVPLPTRSRMAEPTYGGRGSESNVSYQERLLKGYQHQLVGDYDEAMQEYRIIIRNSPELLGEVVSNVRALLKLAPKYSTGYRVLGDAYMRQGEYLQAMEAYNKALTMAKRAKS
jgi:tetratricopeptide (TPR) repeat protein